MNTTDSPPPQKTICFSVYLDEAYRSKRSRSFMVEQTECEWFKSRAESHQQIKPEFVIIGLSVDGALPRQPILGFIFHKTKGIPALLLLFLRGFAQRPDTTTHGLKGFKKSPAATLLDAISPHLASEPNWLMKMLLPEAHQKPVGAELFRSLTGRLEEEIFRAHWDRDRSTFTVNLRPVWQPSKTAPHPFKLYLVEQVEKPVHPATYEIIAAMVSTRRFIEDFFATKTLGVGMRVSLATPKDNCRQEIEAYLSILAQRTGIKWQNPEVDKAFEHAIEIADPREREKMVCVLLPHKLGAILFRVALWIPTPSPAADVITLVALDREGSNEEGRGEQAVLSATDPSPPENPTSLEAAYSKLNEMSELVKNIPPADLDEDTVRDIERLHEKLRGLRKPDKGRTQEGSTVLSVILSPATSRLLEQALIEGRIEIPEEIKLEWLTAKAVPRTGWSDLNITGSAEELRRFLRRAYHHESVVRPWRRLYSFLWPRPEHSPSASVLGDSADRTYSSEGLRSHWRSLYVDLKIGILVWPLVASMLIILSCLFAGWCGQPTNLAWGLATGLVLCLVGAQPCSYVVSPLGCHAGAVFVGWAFGFSQALLMGNTFIAQQITSRNMLQVPFKTITGGLVGLSAPHWRPLANVDSGFSLLVVVIILVCTATGIGMSGWLMGQAKKAKEPIKFRGRLPDWAAASVGFLAGGLIPVVKLLAAGLTAVFQLRGPTAFSCAFAVIGGITMACVVAWRSKQGLRKRRGIVSGIVHGVIAFAIVQFAFWAAQNSSTFTAGCAICAACGYFHATWFTAAYVIGEELSTTRGGVYATLLEGIPFYLAFLITEMLHKPIF